jgi:drug/metabolite transporter (DMT)-like permease
LTVHPSILAALGSALLFGASLPLAKVLAETVSPVLLAGLLYLGSGIGLTVVRALRDRSLAPPAMSRQQWGWLAAAIALGGVLGPILLLFGLARTSAADASLLLNLETVLTAALAWMIFGESAGRRVVLAMALIVAGGAVLGSPGTPGMGAGTSIGALAIALACLCWALDNNLTRRVAEADAFFIASTKGWIAGTANLLLAFALGARLPAWPMVARAMTLGLIGYGFSLVLFVLALRGLGSARTVAYAATAPFVGAAIAIVGFHEPITGGFWLAAGLMGCGVWLHLTERHDHLHTHAPLAHRHLHVHDEHHRHVHDFPWDGREPHSHRHEHASITHRHPHAPDLHHRHDH